MNLRAPGPNGDCLGRRVKKGDFIAFGGRDGNTGFMRIGLVLEPGGPDERMRVRWLRKQFSGAVDTYVSGIYDVDRSVIVNDIPDEVKTFLREAS